MRSIAQKHCAIYARYSSDQQRQASIEDQVARCQEFIQREGGILDDQLIFADYAISGASLQRPGFEQLVRAVESHRVEAIVTEDMSRISAISRIQRTYSRSSSLPALPWWVLVTVSTLHGQMGRSTSRSRA